MPLRLRPGYGYADPFGDLDPAYGRRRRRGSTSDFPPLNVWAGDHDVIVAAEVAGIAPDDIEITVDGPVLTLKGTRRPPDQGASGATHRRERSYGTFARSVTLSYDVDAEKVQAECHDGVLRIYLPRPEAEKPKRIRIAQG